jgi:hypothetical protein
MGNFSCKNSNNTVMPFTPIEECPICLERLEQHTHVTKCNHMFHRYCLVRYKFTCHRNNTPFLCPLCRKDIEY